MNRAMKALIQKTDKVENLLVYLAVPVIIFIAIPPSGSLAADAARLFPPTFWSLLSNIDFLLFDRYVFRGILATGYLLQNRCRILAAIPMALMLVSQLVEIACGIIFGFPERFFQAGLAFRGTGARAVYIVRYFSQFDRIIRVNLTQRVLQSVRRADEFLWHRQPTDSSSGLPCSAQL